MTDAEERARAGGYARAASLTPARRREIASLAARTRWTNRDAMSLIDQPSGIPSPSELQARIDATTRKGVEKLLAAVVAETERAWDPVTNEPVRVNLSDVGARTVQQAIPILRSRGWKATPEPAADQRDSPALVVQALGPDGEPYRRP